jgi:hypothetical protein
MKGGEGARAFVNIVWSCTVPFVHRSALLQTGIRNSLTAKAVQNNQKKSDHLKWNPTTIAQSYSPLLNIPARLTSAVDQVRELDGKVRYFGGWPASDERNFMSLRIKHSESEGRQA